MIPLYMKKPTTCFIFPTGDAYNLWQKLKYLHMMCLNRNFDHLLHFLMKPFTKYWHNYECVDGILAWQREVPQNITYFSMSWKTKGYIYPQFYHWFIYISYTTQHLFPKILIELLVGGHLVSPSYLPLS